MAYDSETRTFSRVLTEDEEAAMLVFCPDYEAGMDEQDPPQPIMASGIDKELMQAVEGVINPCVQRVAKDQQATAMQEWWDSLTEEQQAATKKPPAPPRLK